VMELRQSATLLLSGTYCECRRGQRPVEGLLNHKELGLDWA